MTSLPVHGMLTDRDIVVRAIARGLSPELVSAGDICSRKLVTVSPDDGESYAVELMRLHACAGGPCPTTSGWRVCCPLPSPAQPSAGRSRSGTRPKAEPNSAPAMTAAD
ncbi:hypothetical protein OHA25_52425 [Nonomuraea sp. NBC_00507]|uniref:hypothetical protein n=1 Tax=Nonomuraea sp. NBC_00507 TaxID=2976002 RepID=UPI002E17E616